MAIPEAQLQTWSRQGSVAQSKATYDAIKGVLNDSRSPYYPRSFEIFLQGSYGNDTNVYRDSDVDLVVRLDSTFYYDDSKLSDADKATFHREHPGSAPYSLSDFKAEVLAWLRKHYGTAVREGNKAVFIKGDGGRRDADVLVCAQYRAYSTFPNAALQRRADGIVFWTKNNTKIVNFPKQHAANCTTKHQGTENWFKPTVRVLKNMRNRMTDDGKIEDGLAPSYFLEGLLYNVPTYEFGTSHVDTFVNCINWLRQANRTAFVCANGIHPLFQDGSPISWRTAQCDIFLNSVAKFWSEWR